MIRMSISWLQSLWHHLLEDELVVSRRASSVHITLIALLVLAIVGWGVGQDLLMFSIVQPILHDASPYIGIGIVALVLAAFGVGAWILLLIITCHRIGTIRILRAIGIGILGVLLIGLCFGALAQCIEYMQWLPYITLKFVVWAATACAQTLIKVVLLLSIASWLARVTHVWHKRWAWVALAVCTGMVLLSVLSSLWMPQAIAEGYLRCIDSAVLVGAAVLPFVVRDRRHHEIH